QIWMSKELGLGILEAKIEEMTTVKIHLGHLIEKKNFSTIKQHEQKRTIYLYNKASTEDWKNYSIVLQSSLKDSQAIKRINIVQPEIIVEKKELDQAWNIIHNAIIKAANQTLPRKKVLNTGCSRKNLERKRILKKVYWIWARLLKISAKIKFLNQILAQ
ncbi:25312_t:CDS:2, partial [Gigaspora rosea]